MLRLTHSARLVGGEAAQSVRALSTSAVALGKKKKETPGVVNQPSYKELVIRREKERLREIAQRQERAKYAQKMKKARERLSHPLLMDFPLALRYIRAMEVGWPSAATSIVMSWTVVGKKGTNGITGTVRLPKAIASDTICVITSNETQAQAAKDAGATLVGGEELIADLLSGKQALDFNKCYATPEIAGKMGRLGRVLGPKGMMPSAKKGTVGNDVVEMITQTSGVMPFRETAGCLSIKVGDASFTDSEIVANIAAASRAVREQIAKTRDTAKPSSLARTTLRSFHSPAFTVDA
ncbi:54S ribosomal protein L1 [Yarrowia sp. C11]|nr:54S ribosomal protein L1 [Yarrowia sp. E02]KAG5369533.1 54S ribosomal protein L1 [Yarrowia sp. C11]